MATHPITKVAVVQAASVIFNVEKTLEKTERIVQEASGEGAKLVFFPEAFLSGYPRALDFGKFGMVEQNARTLYRRYWENAIEIPGPYITRLEKLAKENGTFLVIGVTEREGGTLYCTLVFISDEGKYMGKHRKFMPTTGERLVWGRGDGSTLHVYDTWMGKIGGVICWENYMPFNRMTMYSKGIQIYCAPTVDHSDGWTATMQHIGREGRCYVLGNNQYVTKSDYPEDLIASVDIEGDIVCRGGSVIISPSGDIISGPNFTGEGILYADIDLGQIIASKFDMDCVGHYSRPDVFTLYVNPEKQENFVYSRPNKEVALQDDKCIKSSEDAIDGLIDDLTV